jgi:predicted ATPase
MLEYISFKNYKCLSGKPFALKNLNIFTGYNGRGKSSVIQAILMLSQSVKQADANGLQQLHVNGQFVKLGDFDELLYDDDDLSLEFIMKMHDAKRELKDVVLGYEMSENDFKVGTLHTCMIGGEDYFSQPSAFAQEAIVTKGRMLQQLPHYLNELFDPKNVHYVSANRMGPVSFVERKESPEYHSVGANGDMTINTLYTYKESMDPAMNVSSKDATIYTLQEATAQWIDYIMSGDNGAVAVDDGTDKIKGKKRSSVLRLDFVQKDRSFHSYNVGFGFSYILSIVVTALIAKTGNIVIVENPEAHLHPEAQLRLTELLVRLASRGVQVFIETHSEHVMNAVRLAVLKEEFDIRNDQIGVFFFDSDYSKRDLKIEKNGRINDWPSRFFDQYQRELAEILQRGAKIK